MWGVVHSQFSSSHNAKHENFLQNVPALESFPIDHGDDVTVGVVGICKNLGVYYVSDANIECYYLEYMILLNLEQYKALS